MSVSLASLEARVGPYSFPAENWSSLSGAQAVISGLAFEKSDVDSTRKTVFLQVLSVGREKQYSVCLLNRNEQTCILCITEIIAKSCF